MARRGLHLKSNDSSSPTSLGYEMRRFQSHRRQLHRILGDTLRALKGVAHMNLFPLESAIVDAIRESKEGALRPPAIVALGPARARLVNLLLGERLLPVRQPSTPPGQGWRWLRLQHGHRRQIRLSLGTDFEVVEPLLSMDSNWDQIPPQDLKRTDTLDLSTVMDIELCNPFLQNGIQILVPPDLGDLSLDDRSPYEFTHKSTIKDYETFYSKRGSLLETVFPIIIYALDELGPLTVSKKNKKFKLQQYNDQNAKENEKHNNEDNFAETFNFMKLNNDKQDCTRKEKHNSKFYVEIGDDMVVCDNISDSIGIVFEAQDADEALNCDSGSKNNAPENGEKTSKTKYPIDLDYDAFTGLSEENLLDLRQIYELHPNAQVLFTLFSDSVETESNHKSELRLPPTLKVTSRDTHTNVSAENYSLNETPDSTYLKLEREDFMRFECASVSPMAKDYLVPRMTDTPPMMNLSKFNKKKHMLKAESFLESNGSRSSLNSDSSDDSNVFSLDDSKEILLDKQRAFLTGLVEQLQHMSHPFSQNHFTGHWLIVDDSFINEKEQSDQYTTKNYESSKKAEQTGKAEWDIVLKREDFIIDLVMFSKGCMQNYILDDCNKLSEIHNSLLQQFILSSFDMLREMQIIPRKIHYVAEMEQQLYNTLNEKFSEGEKSEELLQMMQKVLEEMKNNINNINWAGSDSPCHGSSECLNMMPNSVFYEINDDGIPIVEEEEQSSPDVMPNGKTTSQLTKTLPDLIENTIGSYNFNDYCIIDRTTEKNVIVDEKNCKTNVTNGEHSKCDSDNTPNNYGAPFLEKRNSSERLSVEAKRATKAKLDMADIDALKGHDKLPCKTVGSKKSQMSFKQASLEVQRAVLARLSRNISIQLVKFVDCLRDSYFGTLQRCLESLEEGGSRRAASEAVRRILLVTRSVDLQQCASFSFLHALVDQLRRFFNRISFSPSGNKSCCVQSTRWRRQVALDTVESLNATKLSKLISTQLRERIRLSHDQFQSALQILGEHHAARLQRTEELKLVLRKFHAPRFARLCLESTSLGDLARYGLPHLSKEIGRGQYGVVYAVKGSWAGFEPCAVKSVVPPDERHFNELAMEFFHTRNIPAHDRIVKLRGSVIDHSYEGGSPAVLLVSERLKWDLHCALLHAKLTFKQRMQIAVDIVEGIRYLHSQGLLHRDIKLKNVLLDENNRAKLTDLGFCIPEAMMSGSIVGTPVHMAPELLSGNYDSSVDVYAFGILFWYVCSGTVKLPSAFEHFQSKEQLWNKVEKGLRPERLPEFSEACWVLMEKCWAADPSERPLLGDVQPILEATRDQPPPQIFCIEE